MHLSGLVEIIHPGYQGPCLSNCFEIHVTCDSPVIRMFAPCGQTWEVEIGNGAVMF